MRPCRQSTYHRFLHPVKLLPGIALCLFFYCNAFGQQSITVVPEKPTILLGEPLRLSISVVGGQEYMANIPDSLGRFEVLEKAPPTVSKKDGSVTTVREITVTSFDSGNLRIPPIAVLNNSTVVSAGVNINVTTLPPDAKVEYGDIKQIIDPNPPSQWAYMIILALLAIGSAIMLYRLTKQLRSQPVVADTKIDVTTPVGLLQRLDQVRKQWLMHHIDSMMLGNQLMDLFKQHLAAKGIYSTSKTGEELIIATKHRYDMHVWQDVVQSIRLCNATRFGKYEATETEGVEAIDAFGNAINNFQQRASYMPAAMRQPTQ